MKNWPSDDARVQFLCSNLRDRYVNELSYDNKVKFWLDFCQNYSVQNRCLSFTVTELEDHVLSICPYRPICLIDILNTVEAQNCVVGRENYESSLTWKSWSFSIMTSPLRGIQSYSPLRTKKNPKMVKYVHPHAIDLLKTEVGKEIETKILEDPTWAIMSFEEFEKLTNIKLDDILLYLKATNAAYDEEFKIISFNSNTKISREDCVWPKIRTILEELGNKIEATEKRIEEQTIIIKSKLRNKADKSVLLRLMKRKKKT